MRTALLFNLPLTGGLIEWAFVILLNIALILFCALYGLYDSIERFYGTDNMFAIVFGPIFACMIYATSYLSLVCADDCCGNGDCCSSANYPFETPLWLIRISSMLFQVVHAGLFILFMASNRDSLIVTAFWLYAIIPSGLLMCYWSFRAYTEIRTIASREYKEALEVEQQTLTTTQPDATINI